MNRDGRRSNVAIGVLFILAAVLILSNQFGFMHGISAINLVATVILAVIIGKSISRLNFFGIFIPAALIGTIYADKWGATQFTPWPALLTAILLSIGCSMVFKKKPDWLTLGYRSHDYKKIEDTQNGNVIYSRTTFGEVIRYINSENFEQAHLVCSFGSAKFYFDQALIPSGHAEIIVENSLGEIELFLPKEWNVKANVHVSLGEFKEKNRNKPEEFPVVYIKGNCSLGEVSITYI